MNTQPLIRLDNPHMELTTMHTTSQPLTIHEQAREVLRLLEAWQALPATDRACFTIQIRWLVWRPAWLSWLDGAIKFILFPPRW
jgi:hypothetical protein